MNRPLAAAALLALSAAACGPGVPAKKAAPAAAAPAGTHAAGAGRIISSDVATVTLAMDPLPALGWPAGQKTLKGDADALAEAVPAPGTAVRFEVFAKGDQAVLTQLRKASDIPAETP